MYTNGFQEVHNFFELDKTLFGYNSNYAEYAKLYTTPYARIEVTDQRGNITNINVEDTSGILNVQACMSLAFPAIGVSCFINGSGGTNVSTLAFQNLDDHFVDVMGKWYDTLIEFDIPIFSVVQANEKTDYFQNYYNRIQAKNNYNTALTNAKENANTTLTNANDSAMTAYNNAAASANNAKTNTTNSTNAQVSNAALQITANNVQNSASNLASTDNTATGNGSIQAMQAYDAGVAWAMQNAESEYATSTAITSAVGGTIAGAASGAMSAGLGGAVAGLIGGVVGGVTNGINTHWAINASADKVQASIDYAQEKVYSQQQTNETINYNNTTACTANTNAANTYTDGATWNTVNATNTNATNTQNTTIANAQRTYNITTGNAQRTYDTSIGNANRTATNAQNAIDNGANQARLSAPNEFGLNTPTVSTANMPMMLQANVVTQNEGAIEQAAAQFARYGYMLNQPWRFTTFNIMKNFTYWKTSDVWLTSSNTLIESARKQIENMLQSGVTVWQNPEKIGTVNVYDN